MRHYSEAAVERAMKVQEVILRAAAKKNTWVQAAEILGVSPRHMRRWKEKYEQFGFHALFDGRRGKASPRRAPSAVLDEVLGLYRGRYFDLNVKHFYEKLLTEHGRSWWHLGHALLLMETCPVILEADDNGDGMEKAMKDMGMPSSALLLLRGLIQDADRALYSDLTESRRGGTVAGWIFHMMIDSSLYRTFAALDRLAHILWNVAGLPRQDGRGKEI